MTEIFKNDSILFFGDSVTAAFRDPYDESDMGKGYAKMISDYFNENEKELKLKFYNRGINGNRLIDLIFRLEDDLLSLEPDLVSILIGVNDIWNYRGMGQGLDRNYLKKFDENFRYMLDRILKNKEETRILLLEPFILPYPEDRKAWDQDLFPMQEIIKNISKDYETGYLPLNDSLRDLGRRESYQKYTGMDGIHPTEEGHRKICQYWLEEVSF